MKYKYLEYLRAAAALAVLVDHIISKLPYLHLHNSVALQSIGAWGTQAVIVFFLLSGIVINHTVKKNSQNTSTFLKKRAIRILPIYYTCVFIAIGIDYATNFHQNLPENYFGTFFFVATLHGVLTFPMSTIAAAWSLSFEVFFYLVYSFTIGKNQTKYLALWGFIAIVSIFFYYVSLPYKTLSYLVLMFAFSSLWLIGYFIYEYSKKIKTNFSTSVFAFTMIPLINRLNISPDYYDILVFLVTAIVCIPIFVFALNCGNTNSPSGKVISLTHRHFFPIYFLVGLLSMIYSKSLLMSRIIYLTIPILSLILLNNKVEFLIKRFLKSLEKVMLFVASISYALYLIHMPIIFLLGRLMPNSLLVNMILILVLVFSISTFLEHFFQNKVNKLFKRS